jgi:hypothetical protein
MLFLLRLSEGSIFLVVNAAMVFSVRNAGQDSYTNDQISGQWQN